MCLYSIIIKQISGLILCACKSVDTYWKHTCLIIATHVTEYYTNFTDKSSSNSSTSATGLVHAVEIAQLPIRFHRAPMDEAEINAINVCILKNSIIVILNYKKIFQSGGAEWSFSYWFYD